MRNGWLLLPVLAGCAAAPPPAAPQPSTGFVTTSDGMRLAYRIEGAGPDTVVVLHGGPGLSGESLRPDMAPLARARTVIYYDQRGSGHSDPIPPRRHVSLGHHLADLDAVRRRFGIERLTLLGHSWGGALAVRYALAYPEHVERLLLLDPMPPRREPYMSAFSDKLRVWMDPATSRALAAASSARRGPGDRVAACRAYWAIFIRGYLADPRGAVPVRGDPCFATAATMDNEVASTIMNALGSWDWRVAARAVRAPVLIVHGSGHFPHAEQPGVFFPAAEAFLAGGWPGDAERVAAP